MNEVELTGDMKLDVKALILANGDVEFTLAAIYEWFGADDYVNDPGAKKTQDTIRRSLALLVLEPDSGIERSGRGIYRRRPTVSG